MAGNLNLINHVNRIRDDYLKGAEDGLDEQFYKKDVPYLFARIEELERALVPFASVAEANTGNSKPLVHVYLKHCNAARAAILTSKSVPLPTAPFELPAE